MASSQKGLIISIVFAALVISGSLVFLALQMSGDNTVSTPNPTPTSQAPAPRKRPPSNTITASLTELIDNDPYLGEDDASVVIVEFLDYQCPFCGRHFKQTFSQIKSEFIDTGKVKYVTRDLPLSFHALALPAAVAAECARDQGGNEMYFKMHDKLFNNQTSLSNGDNGIFTKLASEIGLNKSSFETCIASGKFEKEIHDDQIAANGYGITGTPGFVISNGKTSKKISGAQPFAVFKNEIETLLQ